MRISVVVPVFKTSCFFAELKDRLFSALSPFGGDFELIFVDDGGEDDSWPMIVAASQEDSRCKGIRLSRNYGQHQAISAGLEHATGDLIVVMDGDLQDSPEDIRLLWAEHNASGEVVFAVRTKGRGSRFRRLSSWVFHGLYKILIDSEHTRGLGNFSLIPRSLLEAVRGASGRGGAYPGWVTATGCPKRFVEVESIDRLGGGSSYDLGTLLLLASKVLLARTRGRYLLGLCIASVLAALGALVLIGYRGRFVLGDGSLMVSIAIILVGLFCTALIFSWLLTICFRKDASCERMEYDVAERTFE